MAKSLVIKLKVPTGFLRRNKVNVKTFMKEHRHFLKTMAQDALDGAIEGMVATSKRAER